MKHAKKEAELRDEYAERLLVILEPLSRALVTAATEINELEDWACGQRTAVRWHRWTFPVAVLVDRLRLEVRGWQREAKKQLR